MLCNYYHALLSIFDLIYVRMKGVLTQIRVLAGLKIDCIFLVNIKYKH